MDRSEPMEFFSVRELIADLRKFDPDLPVVLASDVVGNVMRPWTAHGTTLIRKDQRAGEELETHNPVDLETEELDAEDYREALVLWP